jgi:hypothetical protein
MNKNGPADSNLHMGIGYQEPVIASNPLPSEAIKI